MPFIAGWCQEVVWRTQETGHRMPFPPPLVLKQKGSKTDFVFCFHRPPWPLQSENEHLSV